MDQDKVKELWVQIEAMRKEGKQSSDEYKIIKNSLIQQYYSLVTIVAKRMHKKLKEVQEDDLVSWGTDGLFDAVEKFEISLGNKFETYAMWRIRGSILDNIRKVDWIPRLVRQRATKLEKAKQKLEVEAGRSLSNAEIAEKMGISVEEFEEQVKCSTPIGCVSMYSKNEDNDGEIVEFHNIASNDAAPLDDMLRAEFFEKMLGDHFTKLDRKIIHLHYKMGYSMKEIAEATNFSESRISQLHAEIIERLQKKMERNPKYADGLSALFSQ